MMFGLKMLNFRPIVLTFLLLIPWISVYCQGAPIGLWKIPDDRTKVPLSYVRISESNGVLVGHIEHVVDELRGSSVCSRCEGELKNRPLRGLKIIDGLRREPGNSFWDNGRITDVESGRTFSVRISPTADGRFLEVRAYLGFALTGQSRIWERASDFAGTSNPPGRISTFPIGSGPLLHEIVKAKHFSVENFVQSGSPIEFSRGKFETEQEFSTRASQALRDFSWGNLLVFKLDTNRKDRCLSTYDHARKKYTIKSCEVVSPTSALFSSVRDGPPVVLANMIDRREVRRIQNNIYYLDLFFSLDYEAEVDRSVVEKIDGDIHVGILIGDFELTSNCLKCQDRKSQEALAKSFESIARLQNRSIDVSSIDWKREAFLQGAVEEDWTFVIKPKRIGKILFFTASTFRVIAEFTPYVDR